MIAILIILFCLGIMFYQDIRYRQIHAALPAILFLVSIYTVYRTFGSGQLLQLLAGNFIFLFITIVGMVGYMSLKNRRFLNPFENYFGLGDLLFFVAVTPLLLLSNYILFFVASMIFSIIMYFIFNRKKGNNIPLAGYASLLLSVILAKDFFLNYTPLTLIKL